ncbi:MAG TPA: glycine--tRNA ligase subunit beta [Nitrosomonas sp.]|nr:glycine--tRNA ligase subunit beta [Nitrosomonas sp.]HQX12643.1 glycine--tRNA ligase subunit beta [Nitrosomonas sp.]HRB32251.1 glycine--tRNA ligase subunit beta [Nitrosomonas sp.]HRB44913.1 glycine--tRNA ligase subunit beta [Nitrosomonas sp.]HRB77184.1 glycine--tRNA ligase subunit beta [Nitrosomonas sp.]
MMFENLLVELLVEELPPKSLKQLGNSFADLLFAHLQSHDLVTKDSKITSYASPRRLAVHITYVASQAADKSVVQKLMPVAVGLNAKDEATPPLLKKLASLGADASVVPQLKRAMDGKTETLFFDMTIKGTTLSSGLQLALQDTIRQLPIPKIMTYQLTDGWQSVNFVRPAHGLVALHGSNVVAANILGLQSKRETQGHRFEAQNDLIILNDADSYAQQLAEEGAVIASFAERQQEIVHQMKAAASHENLTPIEDAALLDEVTALVEHPNVLVGTFDPSFLQVPQECLILTMKANQKYFPLLDEKGKLANKFLLVSNIKPADPSLIISGNERVVRSRLADAQFFFDQDRKKTLESRLPELDKVVYHNKLGTQSERSKRVLAIARAIGLELDGEALANLADQAARLAKADLLTEMVGEFPELQGIMGNYYACHDGFSESIAQAIEDHYKPRFAGDMLPRNPVGVCVALADKLETLVGLFGIQQIPTGDKDPFALRRHALGVIRILIEKELPLSLDMLLKQAKDAFAAQLFEDNDFIFDLKIFIFDRLNSISREQGYRPQEVEAVLSYLPPYLIQIPRRLEAVRAFAELPEAASLAAAYKRIHNILEKDMKKGPVPGVGSARNLFIDTDLLKEPAEITLFNALNSIKPQADEAFDTGHYTQSLQLLAALKEPVDEFFDSVMVNVEDEDLRANRLKLLTLLRDAMNRVADLSKLAT